MSHPVTTAHNYYNQSAEEQEVLHAADLDVWVAYDGGTVIVIHGPAGENTGDTDGSGSINTPAGNSSPGETALTTSAVTTGTGATGSDLTWSATPTATIRPSTITPSTNLPTLMSETQAPSTSMSLLDTSETQSRAVSNTVGSSSTETLSRSLPTSPSISIVASAEPSSTVIAPPLATSAEYLSHNPPFYVAITLGSIAGVAVFAALIAWALRRQAHERHRRLVDSASKLPWIPATEHDDGSSANPSIAADVENAMRTTNTEVGIINLGSREDMAYLQSWEPRGDRDVGEPKHSEYYVDRKPRPPFITSQIPSYELFSRYSGQQFINNGAASPCGNRVSLGSIDPHLHAETLGKGSTLLITNHVPGDISVSSSQEVGFSCPSPSSMSPLSEIGTPRELVPMPRFLALEGKGLDLPWEEKAACSNDGPPEPKTKSRIMSAEHIRRTWDRHTSHVNENRSTSANEQLEQKTDLDGEGWANSIKLNFVNAFNTVAASLPITAIKEGTNGSESKFTPARPKRSSKRKTLRHSSPIQGQDRVDCLKPPLSRGCTIKSTESDPWSLIQTGSNTGIVHIRLPTSDSCSVRSHQTSDLQLGVARSYTLRVAEPLHIRKKVSLSTAKGRTSISSKDSRIRAPFSRSSTASGSVSPKRHRKSPGGTVKRKITLDRRSSLLFSRTTSMASFSSTISTVSVVTGTEDTKERRLLARDALKDRRRKAKGLKETPVA